MSNDQIPGNPYASGILFPATAPANVVQLLPDSRIVARQQLTDPAFLQAVQADVYAGQVTVLDMERDALNIQGETYRLTDPVAVAALAASQETWVGVPVASRFIDGLNRNANRIIGTQQQWHQQ